jgi:hypothetical protein
MISVLFVGLAIVVNSSVYAENMATREVPRSSEPLADHPVTEDRLQQSIATANFHSDSDCYDQRHAVVDTNVSTWNGDIQRQASIDGELYVATVAETKNGTRVSQDARGEFMPASNSLLDPLDPLGLGDKANWPIANGSRVRAFEMNVTRDELAARNPTLVGVLTTVADGTLIGSEIFWTESDVQAGDGEFWRLYLLEDGDNVTAFVAKFDGGTGSIEAECSAKGAMVEVHLSDAELVGDDGPVACPAMDNLTGTAKRDMYYAGGDDVEGTYRFLVHKMESRFRAEITDKYGSLLDDVVCLSLCDPDEDDVYYETKSDGHPYTTTAIWNATVELTYQDDRVRYRRNVSVPEGH